MQNFSVVFSDCSFCDNRVKYLGIIVDENLMWSERYEKLRCKVKAVLSPLQKLKNILTQSEPDQLYKALFESRLRYSDDIWSNLLDTKRQHLQRLQTRAKTLIENSSLKDGRRCNWQSVSNIMQFDSTVMIYKIVNGICPDSLRATRQEIS